MIRFFYEKPDCKKPRGANLAARNPYQANFQVKPANKASLVSQMSRWRAQGLILVFNTTHISNFINLITLVPVF